MPDATFKMLVATCGYMRPGVNLINVLLRVFVRKFVQCQNVTRKKAFVCKICGFNVDEIDQRCEFHQSFSRSFYTNGSQKHKMILMT